MLLKIEWMSDTENGQSQKLDPGVENRKPPWGAL